MRTTLFYLLLVTYFLGAVGLVAKEDDFPYHVRKIQLFSPDLPPVPVMQSQQEAMLPLKAKEGELAKLFEKVFAKKEYKNQQMIVPLMINGQERGVVSVLFVNGDTLIVGDTIIRQLKTIIKEKNWRRLERNLDNHGYIATSKLKRLGFQAPFQLI